MRVKKYIILAVITILAISIFVSGTSSTEPIDAITRPSPEAAIPLLAGIKRVTVNDYVHHHGYSHEYKDLSKIDWSKNIESQLKKSGLKIINSNDADALVSLNIELAKNKETELVAVSLRLSFSETIKIKRVPPEYYYTIGHRYNCTTWQASKTLILHMNDLNTEVQKHVRNIVGKFCSVCEAGRSYSFVTECQK
jgi:hypothetical protein